MVLFEEDLDHILDHTRDLWEDIRGDSIFITGGTGFFGCWLLESFAWANARLDLNASAHVLTRNPAAFFGKAPHLSGNQALHFHEGDVRDFKFPDGKFSHVIHAATGVDGGGAVQDPVSVFEGMVRGMRRTLEFAERCNAWRFLFTSSGAVYGKQPPGLTHIPEEYAGAPETVDPLSAYGEAKRVSEFLSAMYALRCGFEAKIARCFAFVGPHLPLRVNLAVGNFIGNVLAQEPILVKGDGTPYRSYLYAADLAIWLWTILFRGASGRPYNVGSDMALTIAELAATVASVSGSREPVRIARAPFMGEPAQRYVPSTERARNELGLSVKIHVEEAVRRTILWHKRQIDPR